MEPAILVDKIPHLPRPLTVAHALSIATRDATGIITYTFQVRCAEALYRKRDVFCIAGTGSGKTLAFVMLCFLCPEVMVWVVSPLNFIGNQQCEQLQDWGLRAININASTLTPRLLTVSFSRIH
jgi:superfamily II DNA or RNA helicase